MKYQSTVPKPVRPPVITFDDFVPLDHPGEQPIIIDEALRQLRPIPLQATGTSSDAIEDVTETVPLPKERARISFPILVGVLMTIGLILLLVT